MREDVTIYDLISDIGADEISEVLDHVLFCYQERFPQWSVSVLSINKRENVIEQIDETIAFLEKLKENTSLLEPRVMRTESVLIAQSKESVILSEP